MQKTGASVPPPLADVDLVQPATKRARRMATKATSLQVQSPLVVGHVDAVDVDALRVHRSRLSPIERDLPPVAAAATLPQFAQVYAQLAQINAQLAQINARHINGFAEYLTHTIVPLPVLPQPGVPEPPLPACFPATRQQLMDLSSPDVNTLLEYYGQATNGSLSKRRAQLVAFLGMPPSR
jgi:hypothetical protein